MTDAREILDRHIGWSHIEDNKAAGDSFVWPKDFCEWGIGNKLDDDCLFAIYRDKMTYTIYGLHQVLVCWQGDEEVFSISEFFEEYRKFGQKETEITTISIAKNQKSWTKNTATYFAILRIFGHIERLARLHGLDTGLKAQN
jgi:hypothetical protein